MSELDLSGCVGFLWDEGNADKNWEGHRVTQFECEQIFFNQPLIVSSDDAHSQKEPRFYALGRTDAERMLFVAFTVRKNLIRAISARDMRRREREEYKTHED
ncbi:MAG: BrnT family toxin [Elusimicrobia bacterium]|nr:BrnT family toxin [Elusimicrobiota bacterium]